MQAYIANPNDQYRDLIRGIHPDIDITDEWDIANFVVFTGGTDVNPRMYGERRHPETSHPDDERDNREADLFDYCNMRQLPMIGICRGAQLMCALNGGKLEQHVTGHTQSHNMQTKWGTYLVTSTHHQMMMPRSSMPHELLGWSSIVGDRDPEVVLWPSTRSLAVQYHPEYCDEAAPCRVLFNQMARGLLNLV